MNHAQEAKRLLAEAISDKYVRSPAGFDASTLVTQRAQVLATLALAEQQRIANLIAFLEYADGDTYEPQWNAINEALGLGDPK